MANQISRWSDADTDHGCRDQKKDLALAARGGGCTSSPIINSSLEKEKIRTAAGMQVQPPATTKS